MVSPCRCEDCSTEPEFTWTEPWRAFTEAAEVASWPKERRDAYVLLVAKRRSREAAVRLLVDIMKEMRDTGRDYDSDHPG